jgi:nuclear pore complex protein Nup93
MLTRFAVTFSTTQQAMINFVPLIAYHTGTFRTALPIQAVDYLALICLNSDLRPDSLGLVHTNACHECLRELCLETREFAKLLGDIRSDGTRIPGAIELRAKLIHLETRDEFLSSITRQSAAIADQRGQIADAVLLYHLCEDYDSVISVLNRALADAVTVDLGRAPMQLQPLKPRKSDGKSPASSATEGGPQSSLSLTQSTSSPFELGKNMIGLYNQNAAYFNSISSSNREICAALLRMLIIREHLEANPPRYMTALEELNELGLLPLQAKGSIPIIRAAATTFGGLPQVIARCAGVTVVWAVRAIGGERDRINREGRWEVGFGGDANEVKDQLSNMAKDLMVFAGLVKYKMPGRVYDMLTRAGADVGGF